MTCTLSAMFLIVTGWLLFFLLFLGVGFSLRKVFFSGLKNDPDIFKSFWTGRAASIFFLQFWHLVSAVNLHALIALGLVSCWGWFSVSKKLLPLLPFSKASWIRLVLFAGVIFWLANRALLAPVNSDSGTYHLSAIQWMTGYPLVPGLANLQRRLALGSYFLYPALMEIGPWLHRSHHLANGLLLLVLFAQIGVSFRRLTGNRSACLTADLMTVLWMLPWMGLAFGINLSSPSPDCSIVVLGLLVAVYILELFCRPNGDRNEQEYNLFVIVSLSIAGIVLKLSFLASGVIAILLAGWLVNKTEIERLSVKGWTGAAKWIAFILGTLGIWAYRNVIMTGVPFYPLPYGRFPVDWRVPYGRVEDFSNHILSWGRHPRAPWQEVLGSREWFGPWLTQMAHNVFDILTPLFLVILGIVILLYERLVVRKADSSKSIPGIFLVLPAGGLVFWFLTVPSVRFAGANFWILGIFFLTVALYSANQIPGFVRRGLGPLLLLVIIINGASAVLQVFPESMPKGNSTLKAFRLLFLEKGWLLKGGKEDGFYPLPEVKTRDFITKSGLRIYVPEKGSHCWDTPPPCTTAPDPNLSLRRQGDLRSGFKIGSGKTLS
ncbi:MAG: hypothetical protein JW893_04050 [Candidatus Omnitrophica bacterium]|nr:hypothetical protein [Candidatus Omnitrophota bacterium]